MRYSGMDGKGSWEGLGKGRTVSAELGHPDRMTRPSSRHGRPLRRLTQLLVSSFVYSTVFLSHHFYFDLFTVFSLSFAPSKPSTMGSHGSKALCCFPQNSTLIVSWLDSSFRQAWSLKFDDRSICNYLVPCTHVTIDCVRPSVQLCLTQQTSLLNRLPSAK